MPTLLTCRLRLVDAVALVVLDDTFKIARSGQWDGYPAFVGAGPNSRSASVRKSRMMRHACGCRQQQPVRSPWISRLR